MPETLQQSLVDIASDLRSGKVTATALAEEANANNQSRGPVLGAYKTRDPERFLAEARAADAAFAAGLDFGPLQGIPVSVKDLYGVSGYPTFAGTPTALPEKWTTEGPVVRTLRQSLAPVSGKTHTVEFAFGGLGTNAHWGTPRNPWDDQGHRVPGGSSAGAGVSLCEQSALIALGSDTAGSVRVPASFTGVVGVKTSFGRWSVGGVVPLSPSLDTTGLLARTVADAILAFAVIDPETSVTPAALLAGLGELDVAGIRIGICTRHFEECSPGVAEAVQTALRELAAAGAEIVDIDLPEVTEAEALFLRGGLAAPEFAAFINNDMAECKATLDPNVAGRFDSMEAITAIEYLKRRDQLMHLSASIDDTMADIDILVGPTVPITPPRLEEIATPDSYRAHNLPALRNTQTANLLQLSAVTIPVGLDTAGMPVGMQIMAPLNEDERALAVALSFERTLGTGRERLGVANLCR